MNRNTIKTLTIAGLLIASAGARADVIGTMGNSVGGEILMTDDKCGAKAKGRTTISTDADGRVTHFGCAHPLRPARVIVQWDRSGVSILWMSHWAPNATDRSLKSFSDKELDMLFVRTAWFEGKGETKPAANRWWEDAPLAKPAAAPMLVDQSRKTR